MKARILIVGGGVIGTAVAIRCAQRTDPLRAPVVLIEKSEIGAGSSGRSGAILRQFYRDSELALMARNSIREYASFEARTGRSIGFTRTGVLTLVGPEQSEWQETLVRTVETLADLGIEVSLVQGGAIREIFPGTKIRKGTIGAWEPQAGFVEPSQTLASFAALARNYGAVTRLGVAVEEILIEGGRAVGARTSEGEVSAEQIVLVAGPWSGGLLRSTGVEVPLRIMRPENHFIGMPAMEFEPEEELEHPSGISFDIEDLSEKASEGIDSLDPRGLHPTLIDLENGFYCRCEPATRSARVGRTDYDHDQVLEKPEDLVEEVSEETRSWARAALAKRIPEYEHQPDIGSISAWYTLTPDAQAVIGEVPGVEGLYVATGFSGHGFKLAPSVGEGLAQLLFEEPVTAFDTEFFSPARFGAEVEWAGRFGL